MNVTFINPVLSAMMDVLTMMAQLEPAAGKPRIKSDGKALGAVTGFMHMQSPQITGSLAVSFSEPVILEIGKRMLRRDFDSIDDSIKDLVGEITNMVVGGAKA
jgi:chemotaxis protein CheX